MGEPLDEAVGNLSKVGGKETVDSIDLALSNSKIRGSQFRRYASCARSGLHVEYGFQDADLLEREWLSRSAQDQTVSCPGW